MDELEISGKRYISTKRAGKDHKYHADYIGQLIRAKKVAGQKVGRAWYVDADSLATYLDSEGTSGESPAPLARVVKKIAKVETLREEVIEAPITEGVEGVKFFDVATNKEAQDFEESHIPIKITQPVEVEKNVPVIYRTTREAREARGLRYIAHEGPLLPPIKKYAPQIKQAPATLKSRHESWPAPVHIRTQEIALERVPEINRKEEKKFITLPAIKRTPVTKKRNIALFAMRAGVVLALGAIVFTVAALVGSHLLFTETLNGGQSANASYSLR